MNLHFLSAWGFSESLPEPWQFITFCVGIFLALGFAFVLLVILVRTVGFKAWCRIGSFIGQRRALRFQNHAHEKMVVTDSFGGVDLQDALLGKIIVADLRDHMRAWGSLCAGLLQMIYIAKQRHPELFHHISAAQDQMAAAGQKIANCYENNSEDFNEVVTDISLIRNEFGVAVRAYQVAREDYIAALQKAHARSDGAAKEALNNLRNFSQ